MAGYYLRRRASVPPTSSCHQCDGGNDFHPKRLKMEDQVHDPSAQVVSSPPPVELTPLQFRALQTLQQSKAVQEGRRVTRSLTAASRAMDASSAPASSGALRTSPVSPNAPALKIEGKDLKDDDDDQLENISMASLSSGYDSSSMDMLEPFFHIGLSSKELQNGSKGLALRGVKNESILGENVLPPAVRVAPEDQLHPEAPIKFVENKNLALSSDLLGFCLQNPIAVMRGLASALNIDLGVFTTKTLVEVDPEHPVEIREQRFQSSDENYEVTGKKGWKCYSFSSSSTIQQYAAYQASGFQDSFEEENDKAHGSQQNSDSDSKDSSGNSRKREKMLKFGTNVDLSDGEKWKEQLKELNKLPPFCRVFSPGNMLSHVGHEILGMNTVQLYMKVPGSRTPGHQENNNFCSININIGPGDTEWFATPNEYWGSIKMLCELNNVNYLHGSWWPDLKECEKAGIPVYRFTQKPGDIVWVNSGCVHWVQAIGWCNNIAWNVGPLTALQYQLGIERYEWNKLQSYMSIVPMVHLSWNLARNLKIPEHNQKLFELIKNTLMRSLIQSFKLLEFARSNKIEVRFHGRQENDASHYCGQCMIEVFNVLFIREHGRRPVVHCIDCARKASPNLNGFICLEEYELEDLMTVYDNFILDAALPPPTTTVSIPASFPSPPTTTSHHSQDRVAFSSSLITAATCASTSSYVN